MRVDKVHNNAPNFKGGLNNKTLLKGLEIISDHSASFVAGVSFLSAMTLRPLAISLTPKAEKENKKYASANSIASGLMKLAIAESIAIPVEKAIKNIDLKPEKYLKKETIETLKNGAESLIESKDYKFASQGIKLGTGIVSAVPKSLLTVALIPVVADKILNLKNNKIQEDNKDEYDKVFEPVYNKLSFKGGPMETFTKGVGKIFDLKGVQNFALSHSKNSANIARDIAIGTDLLLAGTSAIGIKSSKKIDTKRKNPLVYNNLISTGASILMGCGLDKLVQKGGKKFMNKFVEANKNNPKLAKYVEGLNILRPTLIFAFVYYGILPVVSTFFADKLDKQITKTQSEQR